MGIDARYDLGDTLAAFVLLHYGRTARRIYRAVRGLPALPRPA